MTIHHICRTAAAAIIGAALFLSCAPVPDGFSVKGKQFQLGLNGRRRSGVIYVPPYYTGTRPYSLAVVLHGAGRNGAAIQKTAGFDRLADTLDFIMVYPNGNRWENSDDPLFISVLLRELQQKYCIDPKRIYAVGHSAGAIATYRLAALLPGQFAAIVPVSGCIDSLTPADASTETTGTANTALQPVSVLHIHARNDTDVPFNGEKEWNLLSAPESVAVWKKIDGCSEPPETFYNAHGIQGTIWRGTEHDVAALFSEGGGHTWQPFATEMAADFMYNHPARVSRITLQSETLPMTAHINQVIAVSGNIVFPESNRNPATDDSVAIEKVEYYANKTLIGTATSSPWLIEWTIATPGVQRLSAALYLAGGTIINSTRNPFILVTAPTVAGTTEQTLPLVKATSSSFESLDLTAENAIDSNLFTRWSSAWTDDESITVDTGTISRISAVTLIWEQAYGKQYVIETSRDGKTWTTAATQTNGQGNIECINFAPQTAQYVRMRGITRETEWGYSLWEFFVHGE